MRQQHLRNVPNIRGSITVLRDSHFCFRVRVYGCRMTAGGRCTYDGYRGGIGTLKDESCHRIRAWMYRPDTYAFFFAFERRPRNFRDQASRRRYLRRLRSNNSNISERKRELPLLFHTISSGNYFNFNRRMLFCPVSESFCSKHYNPYKFR